MTPRSYGQGRTQRAPEARLTQDERDRLIMMLDKDGLSMADWIMKHVEGDAKMAQDELIGVKSHTHKGKHYTAAYSRQAYSNDLLIAWQGRRDNPTKEWTIQSLETETEFFERVESELI